MARDVHAGETEVGSALRHDTAYFWFGFLPDDHFRSVCTALCVILSNALTAIQQHDMHQQELVPDSCSHSVLGCSTSEGRSVYSHINAADVSN